MFSSINRTVAGIFGVVGVLIVAVVGLRLPSLLRMSVAGVVHYAVASSVQFEMVQERLP